MRQGVERCCFGFMLCADHNAIHFGALEGRSSVRDAAELLSAVLRGGGGRHISATLLSFQHEGSGIGASAGPRDGRGRRWERRRTRAVFRVETPVGPGEPVGEVVADWAERTAAFSERLDGDRAPASVSGDDGFAATRLVRFDELRGVELVGENPVALRAEAPVVVEWSPARPESPEHVIDRLMMVWRASGSGGGSSGGERAVMSTQRWDGVRLEVEAESPGVPVVLRLATWTRPIDGVEATLAVVGAGGGGDGREATLEGVEAAFGAPSLTPTYWRGVSGELFGGEVSRFSDGFGAHAFERTRSGPPAHRYERRLGVGAVVGSAPVRVTLGLNGLAGPAGGAHPASGIFAWFSEALSSHAGSTA